MLRVMTLNINYDGSKHGPWRTRRELIAEAIAAAEPDIVALQAVCQEPAIDDARDQARQLAELLPAYSTVIFQAATVGETGRREGQAFMSKIDIAQAKTLELSLRPGLEDSSKRILLHAVLEVGGEPLHLVNAHFSWVEAQCLDNVQETLAYTEGLGGNAMLVGDMNMPPDGGPMKRISEASWCDAWAVLRPCEAGFTFEAGELHKRIDYVWVGSSLSSRLESAWLVADGCREGGVRASDHLGVLVALTAG